MSPASRAWVPLSEREAIKRMGPARRRVHAVMAWTFRSAPLYHDDLSLRRWTPAALRLWHLYARTWPR